MYLVFIFYFLLSLLLNYFLGIPLITPDSQIYLNIAKDPFAYLGFSWHPIGFPLILAAFTKLGINVSVGLALLAALKNTLLYLILKKFYSKKSAFLLIFLFNDPKWLVLQSSLWSEVLFVTIVLMCIFLTVHNSLNSYLRLFLFVFLSMYLVLVRHSGLFLLPGLFLLFVSLAWSLIKSIKLQSTVIHFTIFALLMITFWMITLSPLFIERSHSNLEKNGLVCRHGIIALNTIAYCNNNVAQKLCKEDSNHQWLGREDRSTAIVLSQLHFSEDSPFTKYTQKYGIQGLCDELIQIRSFILKEKKWSYFVFYLKTSLNFLGSWEITERGAPTNKEPNILKAWEQMDSFLKFNNKIQSLLPLLLFIFLLCLLYKKQFKLFLRVPVLGLATISLGHVSGFVLSNPFLSMRYLAIHDLFLLLLLLISMPIVIKKKI